ncbi:uncharacterized protein BDW43DRAFT_316328 [Aspergillus alliaceus]|uniref:uncharacterized protein n=1 Tax=Petromyces alliaceus TaxID=209559 RepID=UPI0012A48D39|nr:uncharacterized protein BDW43DRAFT_316328 [Aspergillus alliaceus]KAB8228023.1 hypothetical protein BDW43DRAFT_316328 [Aspergillus alliaceus]
MEERCDAAAASILEAFEPPKYQSLLEDYYLSVYPLHPEISNTLRVPTRVDAVLAAVISTEKKRQRIKHPKTFECFKPLYLDYDQDVTMPYLPWGSADVKCSADNILWYGNREDLQTNLIISRKKGANADDDWKPPAALSFVHYARKRSGKNVKIYAIVTDSYRWEFMRLSKYGVFSKLTLYWTLEQQDEIICQVRKILHPSLPILTQRANMNPA